jgi:PAS domain S-box-containing protein
MEDTFQNMQEALEAQVEQQTDELTRTNEQLAALYQVGQIITAPLQLEVVLEVITHSTAQLLKTDTAVILLLDETGEFLTVKGAYGVSEQAAKATRDRLGESIAGRVAQTGQPLIANDLPNDPRFYNPAAAKEGLLACASVPLRVGEKIIGTLDVHSRVQRQAFTEAHIQTLKLLASQAAIAIEHARLYEEARRAQDELEQRVQQRTAELVAANEQLNQEITERKQVEAAFRLSEERFAKAFRASPDGIVISRVADGRIIEVNDRWCSLFGHSRAEAIGHTTTELNLYTNPADRQLFLSQLEAQGFGRDFEVALRHKSGEVRQISVSSEILVIATESCILSHTRDITERKRMEAALAEEHNLLRTLIDTLPDSIYIKDSAGRHLLVNRTVVQNAGLPLAEILGKTDLELYPAELARRWYTDDMAIIQSGQPLLNQEEPSVDKNGQVGWDLTTKVPFYDGHGNIIGLVGVTRDITKRKQVEEKLREALAELTRSNTELQQFAYVASHDLQEPLRMVTSYTQLLARRYKGKLDTDADEFIAFAVEGARRMQRLINDLLAYSRVGTKGSSPRPTSSEAVLAQTLANLQVAIADSQAIITHDPLPVVLADETQLLQLFQNLIGNALKFRAEQPPEVHITVQARTQEWLFSVRDNGIGLEPAYAERIFVIFQRLHAREEYPGTGIGLAICKRIVDRHGGRLWVESQPGQGATFYFTLPKGKADETTNI